MRTFLGPWLFVGWTLFVWGTRIRNIINDDELAGFELVWRSGLAVALTALALIASLALLTHVRERVAIGALATLTVVVWIVRAIGIAFAPNHSAAFIAVHIALAAVSIGLASWAWRSLVADHDVGAKMRTPV